MKLTFSPDLGQTMKAKVAPVPSHISDRASCMHTLLFKATFDSTESYLRARSDRFRVELWTNFPAQEHPRHGGEWRAVQFTESEPVQGTSASAHSFSLLTDTDADGKREENTLYLRLRASLQDHIGARFSYTFRLVHASGHVEWLGSQNNNGVIVVEQGFPGVTVSKDWNVSQDGTFGLGESLTGKPLVRLIRPKEWSGWVWKPSVSLPTQFAGTDSCEGTTMVLLPCQSTDIGDLLRPLVIVAGESSSLRLGADGKITVDSTDPGTRQASLAVLEHAEGLLENAVALCNGDIISFDATAAVVATRQSVAAAPYHVVVLPISDTPYVHAISLQKLHLPTPSTSAGQGLVLFSPKLRKAKLLHAPLPSDNVLYVGPPGAELLVSPVSIICENDRTWQVTLLTPSRGFTMRTERPPPSQVLPTPPPSPPHDPSSALSPTSSEIPDLDQSSVLPPRDGDTRPVRSPAPSSSHGEGDGHSTHRRRRSLSMALVRSLPARLVRAYLHAVFNIVFWFWSVFVRAFAVRLVGEGIPRVITRLLNLVLVKTTTRRPPGPSGASAPTSDVAPSNGTQASRLEPTRAPSAVATDDSKSSGGGTQSTPNMAPSGLGAHAHAEPDVPVTGPSSLSLSLRSKEHGEPPRVVISAVLLQRPSSPFMIIHGPVPPKGLCGMFDGKLLPSLSVTPLEDGLFLVEFTEVDGKGELKVSFDI